MKYLPILLLALIPMMSFTMCQGQRPQYAADQIARHKAADINITEVRVKLTDLHDTLIKAPEKIENIPAAIEAILLPLGKATINNDKAAQAVPAVSGVRAEDMPAPTVSADELSKHPEMGAVPPAPKGWGKEIAAGIGIAAPVLLYVANKLLSSVPGIGPVASGVLELGYRAYANKNQRAVDDARMVVHDNAQVLSELVSAANLIPNLQGKIPVQVKTALQTLSDAPT